MRTSTRRTDPSPRKTRSEPRRVLALFGSPRRGGNTDLLLQEFLRGCESAGASAQRMYLSQLQLKGCQGCSECAHGGICVVQDEMQAVYDALARSERIVIASPIYFYGVTAQTKLVIDRAQVFWSRKRLQRRAGRPSGRKGFFISVGATEGKRLFDGAILTVRYFFDAIDAESSGEILYGGFDEKGAVRKHPRAMRECFEAGSIFVS